MLLSATFLTLAVCQRAEGLLAVRPAEGSWELGAAADWSRSAAAVFCDALRPFDNLVELGTLFPFKCHNFLLGF